MDTMRVAELWRYPVKSMAGERLAAAEIGPLGIPADRELVVVDESGRIQTARSRPQLLRHHAMLGNDGRVMIDGLDWERPEVALWVRAAAGPSARLLRVEGAERFDIMPLLVTTDGAIAALGVDGRRLRPNLVIGDVRGLAERDWQGRHLAIGNAVIGLAELRGRCIMTTWDPETGAQDVGVLKRIQREFGGRFALDAWAARPGILALGAAVTLLDSFDQPEAPMLGRYARTNLL
jgi:uncharacterized protein YcbX